MDKTSTNYKRRKELMKSLELPTMSEAKNLLGERLANIVFEHCPEELTQDFGLEPPLEGPGKVLWVSPSDLLIGKVCLKPPLTQKHIQALTHQGILEIGHLTEEKYFNQMRIDKEKALHKLETYLKNAFETEKDILMVGIRKEERLKYLEQLKCLVKYYDKVLQDTLRDLTQQMVDIEIELKTENFCLETMWQKKLKEEVEATVTKMNEELLEKLRDQEKLLAEIFRRKFQDLKSNQNSALEFERTQCKEALMQLRHSLECRNIANLMSILSKERRKCHADKAALEKSYLEEIAALQETVKNNSNTIRRLTSLKNKETKKVLIREKCLVEILRQYQKLINFALRSSPTQAEYLLNVAKMLKYEIDEECYQKAALKSQHKDLPRKPQLVTEKDLFIGESLGDNYVENYLLKDDKMMTVPSHAVEEEEYLGESDVLPVFYFNDKMYIREDFRDMVSTGVKMEKDHPLWNTEVEELMDIFKCTLQLKKEEGSDRSTSKLNHQLHKNKSHQSTVRFDYKPSDEDVELKEKEILQIEAKASPVKPSVEMKKPLVQPSPPTSLIGENLIHHRAASIVEAVDSLEILKRASSKASVQKNKSSREAKLEMTSLKSNGTRKRSGSKTTEDAEFDDMMKPPTLTGARTQSRLTLARDSIILRISSLERKSLMNAESVMEKKADEATDIKTVDEVASQESLPLMDEEATPEQVAQQKHKNSTVSKLLLANDSLELLAKSVTKLSEERELTVEKAAKSSRKSLLTFNADVEEIKVEERVSNKEKSSTDVKLNGKGKSRPQNKKAHCRVLGDPKAKEHLKTPKQFTDERIHSLVNILKQDSSLIRLFTACSR